VVSPESNVNCRCRNSTVFFAGSGFSRVNCQPMPTAAASRAAAAGHSHRLHAGVAGFTAASVPELDSSSNSSSAIFKSSMCWKRLAGSFRKHREITRSTSGGVSAAIWLTGFGSSFKIDESVESAVSP
jgi:hypothetical protein